MGEVFSMYFPGCRMQVWGGKAGVGGLVQNPFLKVWSAICFFLAISEAELVGLSLILNLSMSIRSMPIVAAVFALMSCASDIRLPYVAQINAVDRPSVIWRAFDSHIEAPSLELVAKDRKTHLASIESVFTADAVEALGPPQGDLLQTFTSPSGNTIIAHESASESSPSEHIAVFRRQSSGQWAARSFFPPHSPGPVYGHYGVSNGVDDVHLYYHFPDGRLRKVRLDSLDERPVKHD